MDQFTRHIRITALALLLLVLAFQGCGEQGLFGAHSSFGKAAGNGQGYEGYVDKDPATDISSGHTGPLLYVEDGLCADNEPRSQIRVVNQEYFLERFDCQIYQPPIHLPAQKISIDSSPPTALVYQNRLFRRQ